MAQFAVNVVDSLDRDDTITMFEYDKDLSNGWNLDDDPMTTDGFTNNLGDRGVVFGAEAQQLAFNEALVIVSRAVQKALAPKGTYTDHKATAIDDSVADHTFAFLELFNVSPNSVPLQNLNWQIVTLDPLNLNSTLPLVPQQVPSNTFTFPVPATVPTTQNAVALTALTLQDGTVGSLAAGSPYTIGSRTNIGADAASGIYSNFVVDPNWTTGTASPDPLFNTPSATQLVPQYVAGNAAASTLNLDLLAPSGAGRFVLTDYQYKALAATTATSAAGGFLDMTSGTGDVTKGTFYSPTNTISTFVLRRRLNLNRPAPASMNNNADETDNPFIEVDRITYVNYDPKSYDTAAMPAVAPFPTTPSSSPQDKFGGPGPAAGAFFNLRDPSDPTLGGSGNAASCDIQPKLTRLVSKQRRQPLDGYESGGAQRTTLPGYPTVIPNWPVPGPLPERMLRWRLLWTFLQRYFPTGRVAYYQNQTLVPACRQRVHQAVAVGQPNSFVFSPNTIGQPSQYMPANFNGTVNGYNGSNSGGAATSTPFTIWQPHFDRDFASIGELLSVPLYGPSTVTQSLAPKDIAAPSFPTINFNSLASEAPLPPSVGGYYQPLTAQGQEIFRPQYPANAANPHAAGGGARNTRTSTTAGIECWNCSKSPRGPTCRSRTPCSRSIPGCSRRPCSVRRGR